MGKVWQDNLDLVNYVEWNSAEYIENVELKVNEEDEAGNYQTVMNFSFLTLMKKHQLMTLRNDERNSPRGNHLWNYYRPKTLINPL